MTLFRATLVFYVNQLVDCVRASDGKLRRLELQNEIQTGFGSIVRNNDRGLYPIIMLIADLSDSTWHLDALGATSYCSTAESSLEYEKRVLQVINGLYFFYRKYFQPMLNAGLMRCYPRPQSDDSQNGHIAAPAVVVFVLLVIISLTVVIVLMLMRCWKQLRIKPETPVVTNEICIELETFSLSKTNGCPTSDSVVVTVRTPSSPPVSPLFPPQSLCLLVRPDYKPSNSVSYSPSSPPITPLFSSQSLLLSHSEK